MVGYIKGNFFQRYRCLEHLAHLNQLAVKWLSEEADQRLQATVKQVVAERFRHEAPSLAPLPRIRYDTSYHQRRWVCWDGYIEVCGNRYSVPCHLCGSQVAIRLSLDGLLSVYADEIKVAEHRLRPVEEGWTTIPAHHRQLWTETLQVERRDLSIYQEVL